MNTSRTTPKDFFLHLAATVFLYTAVIALIDLAFAVINRLSPDALQTYYGVSDVAWPISILLVLVPVTYILEWLINRDIGRMPEKKDIWIRRWRIYLTLFLTGVTIVIDLIALINTYLNGEVTSRFIYKVIIVLVVSAVVFAYYILAKNNAPGRSRLQRRILMWVGVALVLAAIIAGFLIVGSPSTQRALRFDEERIADLSNIQNGITNYWQRTGKLPATLAALTDPLMNYRYTTADPESGQPYQYTVKDARTFELCVTFDTFSSGTSASGAYTQPMVVDENWKHDAGYSCFDRTIDPALYPPYPKTTPVPM